MSEAAKWGGSVKHLPHRGAFLLADERTGSPASGPKCEFLLKVS